MTELVGRSISELKKLLADKSVSAKEVLAAHVKHVQAHDSDIKAFTCLTEERAQKQAARVDELIAKGETLPPLAGIPVAIKDNICVADYPTTCSSRILENFIAPYEATVAQKLDQAGALFIGKTNMDEFAMGSSTENSAFKKTANPWDLSRVPGGSSGGSTAAVASGMAVVALGSDTGGSIRQPAAFCGVSGMKPTYGMVSRFGLVAFASSLDQIGPLARSVEDTAIALSVIAGHDKKDSTSIPEPFKHQGPRFEAALSSDPEKLMKGLRVGVITELVGEGIEPEIVSSIRAAAAIFEKLGAKVTDVSLPNSKFALPVYYLIATAEASANLARYDGVKYGLRETDGAAKDSILEMYKSTRSKGFGAEVKRRIMLGTYALSSGYYDAYYKKAQQVRRLIKNDFDSVFQNCDVLISPTSPTVAFKIGEKTDDPLSMYLSDIATIPANLAGLPGISIPAGLGKDKLPIGLQILGQVLSDEVVLKVAHAFQQSTDFHNRQFPGLATVG
ncbi:MAG TPA: Asp-tRNA(Asn)/Glu-tRNA(Gln) amidotransferase subunit GatA [Candidatus Melainabacteria bacterium]|jgi:aspartyl-tRNA(Asn)/glutamyl-tRNA(Gln) amidotransferase subunit A|nr:Asp-tRNA(Asn)/Glu-tRNA(Gln) amidotransferase subunit GatA [Candidatus Melainabacteria bacterium]HIN64763.1 Asp-tRNA(Asn)/Glu-tRNA(Gln) amidotransferase subunit GatA [Candidatus Obscuribacterales bacterium]